MGLIRGRNSAELLGVQFRKSRAAFHYIQFMGQPQRYGMKDLEVGLGQVLLAFVRGRTPQNEEEFKATVRAKDLPKDEGVRRAVIAKLASGELPHTCTLVAMDCDYHFDPERIEIVERQEIDAAFTADGHHWEIDNLPLNNVDFYGSAVDLTERPTGVMVEPEIFNRPPTFRLKTVRVKAADLEKLKITGSDLSSRGRGNPGKLAVWHQIYMEFVARIADGCPPDDDKAWNQLIADVRRDVIFDDLDESTVRKRVQEIRVELRNRGRLRPGNKSG